jgi:hypothetical protein
MADSMKRVLERLRGAVFIEQGWELIVDHTHTKYLVLKVGDSAQAYVTFKRHGCQAEFAQVVFEDGEVERFYGGDADRFEKELWEVIE